MKPKKYLSYSILFAFIFSLIPILPALANSIDRLEVTVQASTVGIGETIQATVILYYTDGSSADITSQVEWQSQDTGIAIVDNTGLITAKANGTVLIDAIYTAPDLSLYSAQVEITGGEVSIKSLWDAELLINGETISGTTDSIRKIFEKSEVIPASSEIALKFPYPIEIVPGKEQKGMLAYINIEDVSLEVSLDKNNSSVVHIRPIFSDYRNEKISSIEYLNWPAGLISLANINFSNNIRPVGGKWDTNLKPYTIKLNFAGMDREPELIASTPENGSDIFLSANNLSGHHVNYKEDNSIAFFFKQPVVIVDPEKIEVRTESKINSHVFNFSDIETTSTVESFGRYSVGFQNIPTPKIFGFGLIAAESEIVFKEGSIKTFAGIELSEPIRIKFQINSNFPESGEVKINKAPDTKSPINSSLLVPKWEIELPQVQYHNTYWGVEKAGESLIVSGSAGIACISEKTGEIIWRKNVIPNGDSLYSYKEKAYSNPVISPDGTIIVVEEKEYKDNTREQFLIGLNQDGSERWKTYLPGLVKIEPWNAYSTKVIDGIKVDVSTLMNNSLIIENDNIIIYATARTNEDAVLNVRKFIFSQTGELVKIKTEQQRPINWGVQKVKDFGLESFVSERYVILSDKDNGKVYTAKWKLGEPYPEEGLNSVNEKEKLKDSLSYNEKIIYISGLTTGELKHEDILLYSEHKPSDINIIGENTELAGYFTDENNFYALKQDGTLTKYQGLETPEEPEKPITPPETPKEPKDKPKDEGGGGTTPEGPKDEPEQPKEPEPEIEPEPEVTPEPEPEPEEITEEEPVIIPEPVKPVTPAVVKPSKPVKPKVIEVIEPEPVKTGIVKGIVRLKDGTPLANARLELHSRPMITRTDSKGYFEFRDVPLGVHKLYLADLKFSSEKVLLNSISVSEGENVAYLGELDRVKKGETVEATQVLLTEDELEKEVVIVADISLPVEPAENKTPYWIIPLILLLLLLILRRRRRHEDEEEELIN